MIKLLLYRGRRQWHGLKPYLFRDWPSIDRIVLTYSVLNSSAGSGLLVLVNAEDYDGLCLTLAAMVADGYGPGRSILPCPIKSREGQPHGFSRIFGLPDCKVPDE